MNKTNNFYNNNLNTSNSYYSKNNKPLTTTIVLKDYKRNNLRIFFIQIHQSQKLKIFLLKGLQVPFF